MWLRLEFGGYVVLGCIYHRRKLTRSRRQNICIRIRHPPRTHANVNLCQMPSTRDNQPWVGGGVQFLLAPAGQAADIAINSGAVRLQLPNGLAGVGI